MARTYRDILKDEARRTASNVQGMASGVIDHAMDRIISAPGKAVDVLGRASDTMDTKLEVLRTTIDTKLLLRDRFREEIQVPEELGDLDTDAYFAYRLATDANMRKTAQQLIQPVLNPTPVETIRTNTSNAYIDIGAGLSAYWQEIHKAVPIEIQEASEVENIIMNLEAGLDKNMEPDTRKLFLKEAGLTEDQVKELVPLSEYAAYEETQKEQIREQIRQEMGGGELTEEEELLVDSLAEDRMMNQKLQADFDDPALGNGPTYEDTYGVSVQDLYQMFGDPQEPLPEEMPFGGENVPVDDPSWAQYLEHPMEELQEIYDGSIEENMAMYEQLAADMVREQEELPVLTDADLAGLDAMAPHLEISDADLEFAQQWAAEKQMNQ